jgi:hypothetical protein
MPRMMIAGRRGAEKDPIRSGLERIGVIAKGAASYVEAILKRTYFFLPFFADFFAFFFAGMEITSSWPQFSYMETHIRAKCQRSARGDVRRIATP